MNLKFKIVESNEPFWNGVLFVKCARRGETFACVRVGGGVKIHRADFCTAVIFADIFSSSSQIIADSRPALASRRRAS